MMEIPSAMDGTGLAIGIVRSRFDQEAGGAGDAMDECRQALMQMST